jgi:hypothetical protein
MTRSILSKKKIDTMLMRGYWELGLLNGSNGWTHHGFEKTLAVETSNEGLCFENIGLNPRWTAGSTK